MFCLGGQTLIPCRASRCSTTKTRGHPPILSTSSPRSLSTRYAFIPPAPRVWVMLLFIKPSFVNELNEGEGGSLPSRHITLLSLLPHLCLIFNPPLLPFAQSFFSWPRAHSANSEDACDFFSVGLATKFPSRREDDGFKDASENSVWIPGTQKLVKIKDTDNSINTFTVFYIFNVL